MSLREAYADLNYSKCFCGMCQESYFKRGMSKLREIIRNLEGSKAVHEENG